ncbi:MAG: sensor histidine kinase [Hyphomicrobiales bacterium]|nr:sensor histidine kinase [Hyphomicrobiales bacterium]
MKEKSFTATKTDWVLDGITMRIVPLALVLISLIAFVSWQDYYPLSESLPLQFKIIEQPENDEWNRDQVKIRLENVQLVSAMETKRSEAWFWLAIQQTDKRNGMIEFQSRHTQYVQCWDDSMRELGAAARDRWSGIVKPALAGFAIIDAPPSTLCRVKHIGPAQVTVVFRSNAASEVALRRFERHSGLLEGGLVMLALTGIAGALINRQPIYLLMAVWIILMQRISGLSFGSDVHWMGYLIPVDWLPKIRALTISLAAITACGIFNNIFSQDIQQMHRQTVMSFVKYGCFSLVILAIILPFRYFLPVMWALLSIIMCILLVISFRISIGRGSAGTTAAWYASSITVVMVASFYEILAAALGYRAYIGSMNHSIAALVSSLLMVVAVMLHEQKQRFALSRSVSMAHENQSRSIARELHDSLGGTLSMLRLGIASLNEKNSGKDGRGKIVHLISLVDDAIRTTRDITHALHPLTLDTLGLAATVRWYTERFSKSTGIHVDVVFDEINFTREHQHTVFRAVQEILTNVAKHSKATYVSIKGFQERRRFIVQIEDNGKGGVIMPSGFKGSLGLNSITERLDALGGEISINSPIGSGTHVCLQVPI